MASLVPNDGAFRQRYACGHGKRPRPFAFELQPARFPLGCRRRKTLHRPAQTGASGQADRRRVIDRDTDGPFRPECAS